MEEDLIVRVKEGDKGAFETLYGLYAEYALRVAAVITGNSTQGADAVQETFIRVYNNIGSFDSTRPFKPWFYKILVNECNRIFKQRSKTVFISDYLENIAEPGQQEQYNFEEYAALYEAVQKMPDHNRIPVVLKYLNGFTEKEIADILGVNVNTVKSRLLRGRQQLKEMLQTMDERGAIHGG